MVRQTGRRKILRDNCAHLYGSRVGSALGNIWVIRFPPPPARPAVALYDLARRLQLVAHIDRHVPKHGSSPAVGVYLLAAILNQRLAPCSKASIAQWFQGTVRRRLVDIEVLQIPSRRFWDNMERASP